MCGIVGYIGPKKVVPLIIDGLRRLEYRGYDSAGIAVVDQNGKLALRRASGKLPNLEEAIRLSPIEGVYGLGHTRWATHGRPTRGKRPPAPRLQGRSRRRALNGIVENYVDLKHELEKEGHKFVTETDTEIVAHLVEKYMNGGPLEEAVRKTHQSAYQRRLAAGFPLHQGPRQKIVAARNGPLRRCRHRERERVLRCQRYSRHSFAHPRHLLSRRWRDRRPYSQGRPGHRHRGAAIEPKITHVAWDPITAEKGGFKHFMLKEIYEQPRAVRDTLLGRISLDTGKIFLDAMDITEGEFRNFREVKIIGCGTSWHAGLAGKFMIERMTRIPVEVDYGSEFRYRDPILDSRTLVICISQSGETADTLAAQREAKQKGAKTLAISNVLGSMITRLASGTILTHCGPEIGVASTKAFTGQLTAMFLISLYLGQVRDQFPLERARTLMQEFTKIPQKMRAILQNDEQGVYENLARQLFRHTDFLYLARGIHYPIALEGALKLKEVSYIHAEGYPAGEMKHGPNALIDENLPVVVLATRDESDPESMTRYEKSISNIQEVKARDGIVISVVTEGDHLARKASDHIIEVPSCPELMAPMLEVVPLQLLAYHIAVRLGCDVDQPRNLAKSVTVE